MGYTIPFDPPATEPVGPLPGLTGADAVLTITTDTVSDPAALPDIGSMIDPPQGMYLGYGSAVDYIFDMGLRPQGIAAPAASVPVDFVRLHTGACLKVIAAVAVTAGTEPTLPSANTNNPNDVLLVKRILNVSPGRFLDGSELNVTFLLYVYALQQMPAATDALDRGKTPLDAGTVAGNVFNPNADLSDTLMGPAAAVSNQPGTGITY